MPRLRLAAVNANTAALLPFDPGANSTVDRIYAWNDTMMVAGNFSQVGGTAVNKLAKISKNSGALIPWFPEPSGRAYAIAQQDNTWLAGGAFVNLKFKNRNRLFAFDPNGPIEANDWNPNLNGSINHLLLEGDSLVMAGNFTTVGGMSKNRLGKISVIDAGLSPWGATFDGSINEVCIWNDTMMVAGAFDQVNGNTTPHLAAINYPNGQSLNWSPGPNQQAKAVLYQNGKWLVGGQFSAQQSRDRNRAYAIDLKQDQVTAWDPQVGGFGVPNVFDLAWNDTMMYLGGNFSSIGGEPRTDIGAVRMGTGEVLPFTSETDYQVLALGLLDSMLVIGGDFTQVEGQARQYAAGLDLNTGALLDWNPQANNRVQTFAWNDTMMLMGGEFERLKSFRRGNIFAIDVFHDTMMQWQPDFPQLVNNIEVSGDGSTVFLGTLSAPGDSTVKIFDAISGQKTGGITINGQVADLAFDPVRNQLFLAGDFTQVNGQSRSHLASVGPTGNLSPLSHDFDDEISSIGLLDSLLFVAGLFNQVDGKPRAKLASIDLAEGLTDWAPITNSPSFSLLGPLAVSPGRVYVAGNFSLVNGQRRNKLAAIDPISGKLARWNPEADKGLSGQPISFIKPVGDGVLVGGSIGSMAGTNVNAVAHLSAISGRILQPLPNYGYYSVFASETSDNALFLGGNFDKVHTGKVSFMSKLDFQGGFFASRIENYQPKRGGNKGDVTLQIVGQGFSPQAKVILRKSGFDDIVALDSGRVYIGGVEMRVPFYLRGEPLGFRDIVIEIPGDTTIVIPDGFEIVAGKKANPWADVVGATNVLSGAEQPFFLTYGNTGDVDAVGVVVWLAVSKNISISAFDFERIQVLDTTEAFMDSIPDFVPIDSLKGKPFSANVYSFIIPKIPAGSSGTIRFTIRNGSTGQGFMRAWANEPLYGSPLKQPTAACFEALFKLVIGFVPYAGCAYAITNEVMVPVIHYATGGAEFGMTPSAAEFAEAVTGTLVGCALDGVSAGVARVILELIDEILTARGILETLEKCFPPKEKENRPVNFVGSFDPNDKSGRVGEGSQNWLPSNQVFPYLVRFENLATATAPAKTVVIRDILDANEFDFNSFTVQGFSIADSFYRFPLGRSAYQMKVDLRPRLPHLVEVAVNLDPQTGVIVWAFQSLDTLDLSPTSDPLQGFLPPNQDSVSGTGSVLYSLRAHPDIQTGDQMRNQASIYFDFNEAIVTNAWTNTIDDDLPSSQVLALADTQTTLTFPVRWTANDLGSGLRYYDLLFREDGGPVQVAVYEHPDTVYEFTGVGG
ncbi:MAG: hypothetical protein AAF804_03710, partial [Bacteroidota bacterium]